MQHANRPRQAGESVLAAGAEHQRGAECGDGNPGVFRRGKRQQPPPVALLEGIENGEDGSEHTGNEHDHAERRQPRRRPHPLQQRAAQCKVRGVHDDARHQRATGTAAAAVGARVPLVKRQQAELGAKAHQPQQPEEERAGHAPLHPLQRIGAECQALSEHEHGKQQGHAADFQQREHEQIVVPGLGAAVIGQQHQRPAKPHHFPGDEKTRPILQTVNPQRAEQGQGSACRPAASAGGAAEQPGKKRRQQCGQHQPQCCRIGVEHHGTVAQQQHGLVRSSCGQAPQRAHCSQRAAQRQQVARQRRADE